MQRSIPTHHIEDEPMEDAAPATSPRFFLAVQDCPQAGQYADGAQEFFRMTPPNHAIAPADISSEDTAKRLVRQVSVPISESSALRGDSGTTIPHNDLATQLAAALAANARLQSQLDIQCAHALRLEEKVVSQGQTVSALCVEVDRLTKDNEELNERLVMQMEQRKIETEQFRHHLAMFKATGNRGKGMQAQNLKANKMNGFQPRMSLPGSPYPPSKLAAVAPATATSPVRRMSTVIGPPTTNDGQGHIMDGAPPQPRRCPPRRMSTGAAATCA